MRSIYLTFVCATASVALSLSTPSASAALLTVGPVTGAQFGGYLCADVFGGNIDSGTAVQVWDCHGAGNQKFEFNNRTVYAMALQRCLQANGTVVGSLVVSAACDGGSGQQWRYDSGYVKLYSSGVCLGAGNGAPGTQLKLEACSTTSPYQKWQIK